MERVRFTIFTPTFNRAHTLATPWEGLKAQTFPHSQFEWLIIDDGSTDETPQLVEKFKRESDFTVRYFKLPKNMGKHYCHNRAVELARGELFLVLDSDDSLIPEGLEIFWRVWEAILPEEKKKTAWISCLTRTEGGKLTGGPMAREGLVENLYRFRYWEGFNFEAWSALNLELLKKFKFPEGVDKFIPESYIWDQLALHYLGYHLNIPIRIALFRPDGFTLSAHPADRYPRGTLFYALSFLQWTPPKWYLLPMVAKRGWLYLRAGKNLGLSLPKLLSPVPIWYKPIVFVAWVGMFFRRGKKCVE